MSTRTSGPVHPMQPVVMHGDGVIRFKRNQIVEYLLDWATSRGLSLNELARMQFSDEDRTQFAQLIGYSVSGAGDLDYFDREVLAAADVVAKELFECESER